MSVDYTRLGKKIKSLRESANLTQEQLAQKLDVSPGYISKIECCKTKPNLEMLSNMSIVLNCNMSDFFDDFILERDDYLHDSYIENFSKLSKYDRDLVLGIIELLLNKKQ